MTEHTFEVFKWSGNGYNNTYEKSYKAVIEDDDASYKGGSDKSEKISIDGGSSSASAPQPYAIDVSFTDTGGAPHVETFYFMNADSEWYFTPGPGSEFTVGSELGMYLSHTTGRDYATGRDRDDVACFASGTLIETIDGPVAVETLVAGAMVMLEGGAFTQLRLCLSRVVSASALAANPRLKPVKISADALGQGLPKRDLLVSRQHRMLVNSKVARRMFGGDVLIPAIKLTILPGIFIEQKTREVIYYHLLFDRHEVIIAEGAPSESFYVTQQSLAMLKPAARKELETLFPELTGQTPEPARPIPCLQRQKRLIARHRKNAKPLILQ